MTTERTDYPRAGSLVRAIRVTVIAAVVFGSLAIPTMLRAADANQARLPRALDRVSGVKRIYPGLYRNEAARKFDRSWNRLRRRARTRWMHSHRCADATLERRYQLGASSWSIVEATWACGDVPSAIRSFLGCIADHEGGRTFPDVWYGGSRGWQSGRFAGTDTVVNSFQTRPYWADQVDRSLLGRDALVTRATFDVLTNPINAARIAVRVGPGAYATRGLC